jgi:type I protein arginine methyltransferase
MPRSVSLRAMYTVLDYGRMAADGVRMDAYARAIAAAVKPGSVVVDIGAGTGIFSILAARAGAKRVHAIEPNPAIWLVPELARENGVSDRITVHHASSLDVTLDERADVVISDMRGTSPLHGDHIRAIRDARERFLAPGGALIPQHDRLFVALVENDELTRALARGWLAFDRLGLSASAAKTSILNSVYDDRARPLNASDVLSTAASWGALDYATCDGSVVEATVDVSVLRGGKAHGLAIWFDATVADGIGYTSAPGWSLAYARTYLPLADEVSVAAGDAARITVRADARGGRWAWDTRITSGASVTADLRQSTFLGAPTSAADLLKQSQAARPERSKEGDRVKRVLEGMNGERTIRDLALLADPDGPDAALDDVREVVARYAR